MRGAAQLISYEVSQGLALVGVIISAGTLSLTGIVHAQQGMWYIVPQFAGFLIFMTASFAETNRAPFDVVEGDSEIVGGYFTEYGGTAFVAYLFAEYANMIVVSGMAGDAVPRRLGDPRKSTHPRLHRPVHRSSAKMFRLHDVVHLGPHDPATPAPTTS